VSEKDSITFVDFSDTKVVHELKHSVTIFRSVGPIVKLDDFFRFDLFWGQECRVLSLSDCNYSLNPLKQT